MVSLNQELRDHAEITRLRAALTGTDEAWKTALERAGELEVDLAAVRAALDKVCTQYKALSADAEGLRAALAEAERERDELREERTAYIARDLYITDQRDEAVTRAEKAERENTWLSNVRDGWKDRAEGAEANLAAAREVIKPFASLNIGRFMSNGCRYKFNIDVDWVRQARAFLERTATAAPGNEKETPAELSPDGGL